MKLPKLTAYMTATIVGLGACSSAERKVDNLAIDKSSQVNPSTEIAKLDSELQEGKSKRMPLLSPTWFWSAERSVEDAKLARDNGNDVDKLFREVAEARAQLDQAKKYAAVSESVLAGTIQAREQAEEARVGANRSGAINLSDANEKLRETDEDFMNLAEYIENGKVDYAQAKQRDVAAQYKAVTTEFIKLDKLGPAKRVIAEAKQNDADDYAPKTLAFAENYIEAAEKFIDGSPTATKQIDQKSQEALTNARRALVVSQQSRELSRKDPENTVLWVESHVANINSLMGNKDHPDTKLEQQFGQIETEAHNLAVTQDELSKDSKRMAKELKETRPIARLDAKMKELRTLFSPEEADVVMMDDKVILRLKGLKFPVGKATLESENFPLLAKAQEALASFPEASVVIEGHTDASGTQTANEKLSKRRAETVKNYLVSSDSVTEEAVKSVGKGYTEPIASNRTKEGRASNRRIDIVIDAEKVE